MTGLRLKVEGLKFTAFFLVLTLGFALSTFNLHAANKDTGTTGAQFLKIGAGARPSGMGEAFTGLADDVNAIAWNPAGLAGLSSPQFTAMHTQWFQQTNYEFVAAAHPWSWGTLGIGMASLTVSDIEKRLGDTDAPDGTFDSNDAAYTLSYARSLGEDLAVGVNAGFVRLELDGRTASAFKGDAGALWHTPHRPLSLGFAVRNAGSEVKFVDEGDPLPMTATLGAGYRLFGDRLRLGLDIRQPNDNDLQFGGGAEWAQPFFRDLSGAVRAGYNTAGTDAEDLTGVSVGLGLAWRNWGFDTAWVPYGSLGQTFRYALLVKF
jgi:hypothetical protein